MGYARGWGSTTQEGLHSGADFRAEPSGRMVVCRMAWPMVKPGEGTSLHDQNTGNGVSWSGRRMAKRLRPAGP